MTSDFLLYLKLGFWHISDLKGYDHIVFIVALCAVYSLRQWRNLLMLVTAFTIGHSVTLALATLNFVNIDSALIEFLIPVTILLTSLMDLVEGWLAFRKDANDSGGDDLPSGMRKSIPWRTKYGLAMAFGLIHGLGFSNFLRAILGGEESILLPLLSFNIGLEFGQLAILLVVLTISMGIVIIPRLNQRNWAVFLSVVTAGIAVSMIITRSANL
jgi:HupE / UreJ protein